MSLRLALHECCEWIGEPLTGEMPKAPLPTEYLDVLAVANGFVLKGGRFRFLGLRPADEHLDALRWNEAPWISEYGRSAHGIFFIAEDVLGDQYGFLSRRGKAPTQFVKFFCEGGEIRAIGARGLQEWLLAEVLGAQPTAFDDSFVVGALEAGLKPGLGEHLAFILPLICGGALALDNLEVAEREFHLHLLGQLSSQARAVPDGAPIGGFVEDPSPKRPKRPGRS